MRTVQVRELSLEAFEPYGWFANMINPDKVHLGQEPIEFYRDMLPLSLDTATNASFSICRVKERPGVIDVTEYHAGCGEGILPLDADVLCHVGPASQNGDVPLDDFEVFRVPKGTMLVLKAGVWHHAPVVVGADTANVLIVLPERTYARDCEVYEIPAEDQIQIEQ